MLLRTRRYTDRELQGANQDLRPDRSLQIVLWLSWTFVVAATANYVWQDSVLAGQPVDLLRLVLRCAIVGVIGLIVITKIEMQAEPWRFVG